MNVGIFLSAHHPPGGDTRARLRELAAQAELAEELGLCSLFLGHHYLASSAFLQPLSVAAYLAARTERVRIGFGILLGPLLPAVALAEELATLDQLSDGRLIVGLGTGYREKEYAALGVPFEERFRRLDDTVTLLRRLWSGEPVDYDGVCGTLRGARLHLRPAQDGGPPIWLGAFTPRGIRRVAEHDACWLAAGESDDETIAARLSLLRDELSARGLTLERSYPLMREACAAPDRETALRHGRKHLLPQFKAYRSWRTARDMDPDELLTIHALLGTPDDILERMRPWARLGITDVIMRVDWHGMDQRAALESIRLIGREIAPVAAGWSADDTA